MSKFSIGAYLSDTYGLNVKTGQKFDCPFCGHHTMQINKTDELAKCFHPSCGRYLNAKAIFKTVDPLQKSLQEIVYGLKTTLCELQDQSAVLGNAWDYLVNDRQLHPQVIQEALIGAIPREFEEQRFKTIVSGNREKLEVLLKKAKGTQQKETAENKLNEYDDTISTLQNYLQRYQGWIVFPYSDKGILLSLKFREPYTKNIIVFKPFKRLGVYDPLLFSADDASPMAQNLVLAEGEFNILQLQSLGVRVDMGYFNTLALGGASSVDWETLKKSYSKGQWLLFKDHDSGGDSLATNMQTYKTFYQIEHPLPGKDLDDFIKECHSPQAAWKALIKLTHNAQPKFRANETIADEIVAIRSLEGTKPDANAPKLKVFQVHQMATQFLVEELQQRGHFYRTRKGNFFLDKATHKLYPLTIPTRETQGFLQNFGLNPTEIIQNYILKELDHHAQGHGDQAEVYSLFHYDEKSHRLYIFNRDTEIYRLSLEHGIEVFSNGIDGVLFQPPENYTPFTRETDVSQDSNLLQEVLINKINFDEGLIPHQYAKILFELYFYHLFFDELHSTHPLVAFIGPMGSSKTSSVRRTGLLLYGPRFEVSSFPEKQDDFDVAITNNCFVGFDNVDGKQSWMHDRFAVVSTGGSIKKRVLYTTNTEIDIPITCHLWLTSMSPKFTRADVVDRLLLFYLKPLAGKTKISESELKKQVLEQRNIFMSWLLLKILELLEKLARTRGQGAPKSSIRYADFYAFSKRVAMATGEADETLIDEAFDFMKKVQSGFALEHEPLLDIAQSIANRSPKTWYTPEETLQIFKKTAQELSLEFPFKSVRSLSQKLNRIAPNLQIYINLDVQDGHARQRHYRFSPKT